MKQKRSIYLPEKSRRTQHLLSMSKKECPSCAMEIDSKATICPICAYEFPAKRFGLTITAILLLVLIIFYVIYQLR